MNEEYTGKCYRHGVIFNPQKRFNNTCPACWWELQTAKEKAAKPAEPDKNVQIKKGIIPFANAEGRVKYE